ncbi:glycoside hydrolase family 25 protein [Ethanoligenens harbinense]|uniref:Glycoside hydrolase family 25 n=1 Tax=Ethanoligenens harbinense (strain DSM 18485 / JCM 12961 / CGMCC 1.5033 / YUAN-3) TaxID=663278 RepID=E6U619_ETHHY|nr:glycoside hydrolase family 25 protein [Ethanoligenens harbinense]ADU25698.1 glycoside hydrolase family 25 [Ethanoligenens harbinense YUAN-3]
MHKIIRCAAVWLLTAALLCATVVPAMAVTPPGGAVSYHGVDIYHGTSDNGQINWNRLAQTQNFVYIKTDEGISYVDRMWTINRTAAAAHGMAWGPYHFLRLNSDPVKQADSFWARIRGTGYSLVPAVDVESYDGQQSAASMRQIIRAFITELQRVSGITPVLYTYTAYANDILRGQFTDCPLWLADYRGYAGDVVGWGAWDAWQYSEHGQIEAISNNEVDLDYATAGIYVGGAHTPANPYPYIISVQRGNYQRRTVRTSASWSARVIGHISVGDNYEIMGPTNSEGWVQIGLCGHAIGYVPAYCF